MPIRFRCAYCNQLMGIARRKAGTVVTCPKCQGQVIVPAPGAANDAENERQMQAGAQAPANPGGAGGAGGGLFEESDFEQLFAQEAASPQMLNPSSVAMPRRPAGPQPAVGPGRDFEAIPLGPGMGVPARGLFLSPAALTVVCVLIVVLLGMAFFLGLLVGRS